MQFSQSQQAYAQTVGTAPTNFPIIAQRDPDPNDVNYALGGFWINQSGIRLWYLNSQNNMTTASNAIGALQSVWELISTSSILVSLSDTSNTVVFPSSPSATPPDNIQIVGGTGISVVSSPLTHLITITNTGAASNFAPDTGTNPVSGTTVTFTNTTILSTGTLANAIRSNGIGATSIAYQLQYAGSNAGSSIASNWGVAQFDANQFTVNSGFVQLAGGTGPVTLGLIPDAHTAPGTTPVIPNGSGNITLEGGTTFATGTQAHPIRTNSLAANTIDFQIQLAGSHAATSTPNDFGVSQFDANHFTVTSGYVQITGGGTTGAVTNLIGDDTLSVVPTAGVITLLGSTVANATHAKPVFFVKNATSTEELDVQLATTTTSGAKNINKSGLSQYDSAVFTIDSATGFVSLVGGSSPVLLTLTGNTGGQISPSLGNINTFGFGSIIISGSGNTLTTQLTGLTNHNVLVGAGTSTITNVAPTATSGIPLISQGSSADPLFGTAVVAGGGTGDTSFTAYAVICGGTTSTGPLQNVSGLGTSGQVLTSNGAGALPTWQASSSSGAVTQVTLDAATSPITPSAGNITLTGGQVATGVVGANVIRTRGNTASSATIEIQRSTSSAVSNSALNGVSHFDSSKFGVDTNGFVTFIGSTSNIPWTDEGGNFNAASNNGYFFTALLTSTLPPTPAQGDVIRIVVDTTSVVTLTANTGQKIRIGNVISSTAGTAASTKQGDSVDLVYRSASATWYEVGGSQGSWSIT